MNTALLSCSVLKFSMIKLVWRSQAYKMDEKTLSIARMHTLLSLYFFLFFPYTYLPPQFHIILLYKQIEQ